MSSALEVRTEDIFKDRLIKAGYTLEGGSGLTDKHVRIRL